MAPTPAARSDAPLFTLIENGELFSPEPLGVQSILIAGEKVVRIGSLDTLGDAWADARALAATQLGCEVIDASGCYVIPGLVDPHAHLIGAGGEQGFGSRMPEVPLAELLLAGVTTVVGCLGTDTITRTLPALLGKVRELEAQGLTAYLYTGGFQVPPPTITGSVLSDLVLIDKVIGVAEIAISDVRSSQPSVPELARLVADAHVGGTLSGKAGVTHFHVGPGPERLAPLVALLERHDLVPSSLYPTHVTRSAELLAEAAALARRGAYVDTDTVEEDLPMWLRRYQEHGGPLARLTVSSDAHTKGGSHARLFGQLVSCCREHAMPLAHVLPLFTSNPAAALGLSHKGRLREAGDADLVVLTKDSLRIRHVLARGRALLRDGVVVSAASGAGSTDP